jgi:hypothetical protein
MLAMSHFLCFLLCFFSQFLTTSFFWFTSVYVKLGWGAYENRLSKEGVSIAEAKETGC